MSIPSCITNAQICSLCNTAQSFSSACTSKSSKNSKNNEQKCSVYCNSGCNTKCNTAQTYCNLEHEFISSVGGSYPIKEVCGSYNQDCGYNQYDRIDTTWSATNWNSLIKCITTAENSGSGDGAQGSVGTVTAAKSNDPITMSQYNEIVTKLNGFNNTSIDKASRLNNQDIITATKANALRSGYNNAKFKTTVCDICNAGEEHVAPAGCHCNCNCSCACSCACGCSCPCNCSCNCTNPDNTGQ